MPATLAALESALATGTEAEWLAQLSDEKVREQVQRALQADRKLWTQYPDSLGSCLLARTFGVEALASLHRAWSEELAERGRPWIRPLRQCRWRCSRWPSWSPRRGCRSGAGDALLRDGR
ncbi:hypothetical protein [Nannocystis pusilla]|uniref:hypothetical protein n=1 Tax=Nannocystis pusilla TaxID=889268 RepID=UPI003B802364